MTSNGMHWLRLPEWWMKPKMILNSLNDLLIWTSGQQEIRGKFVQHFKETINVVCQNMQNKWNSKQNPHYFIVILLTNTPKDNTTDIYTICVIWDTKPMGKERLSLKYTFIIACHKLWKHGPGISVIFLYNCLETPGDISISIYISCFTITWWQM